MNYQFSNDLPIYLQLIDAFKTAIVSGELKSGDRLDSVRDLALEAKVNPNTMQKALSELERMGLVRTERTAGRYITEDSALINSMKNEFAAIEAKNFINKMTELNLNKEEILGLIESLL